MTLPLGEWEVNDWRVKFTQGTKADDDRRVWVASPGGEYCLLSLAGLGAVVKAWYVNEDVIYLPLGGIGGQKVLNFLTDTCTFDLETACERHQLKPPRVRRLDPESES